MKSVELNKKQKLVGLVLIGLIPMLALHFLVFSKKDKSLSEMRGQYEAAKNEFSTVKGKQKAEEILAQYVEDTNKVVDEATKNVKSLMLFDTPVPIKDEKDKAATPADPSAMAAVPGAPGVPGEVPAPQPEAAPESTFGTEKTLHPSFPKDEIYRSLITKLLKLKSLTEGAKTCQVKVLESWGVEFEIKGFDQNAFPDIVNNLRTAYQVIDRKGVSDSVVSSSKAQAVRLRRELGLNMRMMNNPDPYIALTQKLFYVHFLEDKIPASISLADLISYMDITFPEEKDGGILVGYQALLEYTNYLVELAEKKGIQKLNKIEFKDITFDGESDAAAVQPGMFPGMDPGMMMPGMMPGMPMDPAMMMPGMMPGMPGMPGMMPGAAPAAAAEPETSPWETAKGLRVAMFVDYEANNLEGMDYLSTIIGGRGFFNLESTTIRSKQDTEGVLGFTANLFNYAWINMKLQGQG